ncbi:MULTISPECIES: ABC transporter permease [unclassified Beijerinckia]|uniref:ABC transporter permease n=1 Tax=unclassified Beijerinckia TaxID=2638183 RepID=UPI00089AFD30|nr:MULTISPECIES: ABC transporter permease [unclassified Beijerinckia]MDH7794054.1 NitT/TauT family transport system permease protein [Beijerinckia sp. GAS462]SEB52269.1 NitT/TauT family transport system permease protein [Beijerinckia sp. 28-YEA-48]
MNALTNLSHAITRNYSIILAFALYELASRLRLVSPRLFPSLEAIFIQFWRYTLNGDLPYHAAISLMRAFIGFALAAIVGLAIGWTMARSRRAEALIEPIFSFGYPMPKIALYPIFIFVFGLGTGSKVALIFLECVYPIAIHVYAGVRATPKALIWAARNMNASPWQISTRVLLPAAAPTIFTGLRIALPVALIVTLVTEIIGESRGLGYFITFATSSFEYARALAAFLMIALIGFVLDRLLIFARDRLVFWDKAAPPVM